MNDHQQKFEQAVEHFKHELATLRIGRASAGLVEGVMVETYGQKMPLSHIASVNIPDAKTIAIQPWDKVNSAAIEKAIIAANIGLSPVNDGNVIRLSIPPMTEDRRKEMVKMVGKMAELARISIRNVREEVVKDLKSQEDNNQMTTDDVLDAKTALQKEVDAANEQVKDIAEAKEKEILTI